VAGGEEVAPELRGREKEADFMPKDKTPPPSKEGGIGAVEAYEILKQRQINEDRILAERTSMFLVATAFLFAAFVVLLTSASTDCIFAVLRILLPSVGISLTFLLFFFNLGASRALTFWHIAQRKIEEDAEAEVFEYMKKNDITPHIAEDDYMDGKKEWVEIPTGHWVLKTLKKPRGWYERRLVKNRVIYKWCLPIAFFVLWVTSLVSVSICYF
jgi:energy-converting hydrogenase Eha subunit E